MLGLTGFLGLTRIPLCFWAHTDLTHGIALWVGNLTDASVGVGWFRGAAWGSLSRIYFSGPSDPSLIGQIRPIGPIGRIGQLKK